MTEERRLVARVRGRVQGVGFRIWAAREARRLALGGWVRNCEDERSIELVAEGRSAELALLEGLLRQGPPGARVERVEVRRESASGAFDRFEIRG